MSIFGLNLSFYPHFSLKISNWIVCYRNVITLRLGRISPLPEIKIFRKKGLISKQPVPLCPRSLGMRKWWLRRYILLLYGQLRERTRLIKSCAVVGYPSGQDGAILRARDYPPCPARNFRESHIINPLLTKLVRSKWLDIGLVLF